MTRPLHQASDDEPAATAAPALSAGAVFLQWRKTMARLAPFGRPHRRVFWAGVGAAGCVIVLRLALPLVFRGLLQSSFEGVEPQAIVEAAVGLGAAALVLAGLLGLADHLERLFFARYAAGLSRDVRKAAFADTLLRAGAEPAAEEGAQRPPGEIAYGLIGDTARMKTGIKGFLVHVATNLVLCAGVVVVMMINDVVLGAIFALTCALTLAVTTRAALRIYGAAKVSRKRESKLADSMQVALLTGTSDARTDKLLHKESANRVIITKAQGETTWAANVLFGASMLAATLYAAYALGDGTMSGGGILTFLLYALMVRAPLVQLARQGARAGKIFASAHRVSRLLRDPLGGGSANAIASESGSRTSRPGSSREAASPQRLAPAEGA